MRSIHSVLVVKIQIAVAEPSQIDVRLALSTLNQETVQAAPLPPPAPPSSPSVSRNRRRAMAIRRGKSLLPADSHLSRPDGQAVPRPAGGVRPASDGHLLDAMTIEPVLRRRDQSSTDNRMENDWEELDMVELPITPFERKFIDQSTRGPTHRQPSRPTAARVHPEPPWVARRTGNRQSVMQTSVQHSKLTATRKDNNVDKSSKHTAVEGRGLFEDESMKQLASLPRLVALRRNRSEKNAIMRGLPSRTVQMRRDVRSNQPLLQLTSQLSEASKFSTYVLYSVRRKKETIKCFCNDSTYLT